MKKAMLSIICLLITSVMIFSGCSVENDKPRDIPEITPDVQPQTDIPAEETDVKTRVDAMLPIMDSLICTSGANEDYEPQNPEYFWSVLYLMGVNWGQTHPLVTEQDGRMVVGRQTMQEFASAAFIDYDDLVEIPEELTEAITYDEALDSYMLMLSDRGDSETRIDDWTVADDGTVTAYVGLYEGDGAKIAMYVVTLGANEYASGISVRYTSIRLRMFTIHGAKGMRRPRCRSTSMMTVRTRKSILPITTRNAPKRSCFPSMASR